SRCGYSDVVRGSGEIEIMLSLGTGDHTRAYTFEETRSWGQLEWARPVLDIVFDGVSNTIDFEAVTLMGEGYVRLQPPLGAPPNALDDASPKTLAALTAQAEKLIAESDAELDRVCAVLAA